MPLSWRIEFEDWADSTLLNLSEDLLADSRIRAYARWELAYRKAFGLRALLHPETGLLVRMDLSEPERTGGLLDDFEAAEIRVKERAAALKGES